MDQKGRFKKGWKGGPGRPPALLPEVQTLIDRAKNELKTTIVERISPKVKQWIDRIIEQGVGEGDVVRFKMLMEIALGKLVDEPPEFPVSEEEKILVKEYRRRKKEQLERDLGAGSASGPNTGGGASQDSETQV
jgi:hypothetical protein